MPNCALVVAPPVEARRLHGVPLILRLVQR